jgi:hypothetical protein
MEDNILQEFVGKVIEGVDYEDCILTIHTEDEKHWMFEWLEDGSLAISLAEGTH